MRLLHWFRDVSAHIKFSTLDVSPQDVSSLVVSPLDVLPILDVFPLDVSPPNFNGVCRVCGFNVESYVHYILRLAASNKSDL